MLQERSHSVFDNTYLHTNKETYHARRFGSRRMPCRSRRDDLSTAPDPAYPGCSPGPFSR